MNKGLKAALVGGCIMVLSSCEIMFVNTPKNDPEAVFENLWQTFEEEYAPFDERNVDWMEAYHRYRPLVNRNTTDDELFMILTSMLELFDDGHINLIAPTKRIFNSNRIRRSLIDDDLFNKELLMVYLEPDFKVGADYAFIYGKIKNENVAYIFFDHVGENFFELQDFLKKYESVNGLIIDLRHNHGGDFTYCFSEMARLTNEVRYVFQSKTKNGKGKDDFTPWSKWFIRPQGQFVNKPIILLTDRYTISAGERAVMAFKTLPNVTVVGDTTNGAHGTMIGRELANGWYYSLVPQKVMMFDGRSYEGVGLAPDVYLKNQSTDVKQGIDQTLEYAISRLK